ncbi:MAG: hypothetical protein KGJ66_13205 [Alphaproteobacteria bacterium]|nr:hypothetical protein [Alphaproteobacteria bacterium]
MTLRIPSFSAKSDTPRHCRPAEHAERLMTPITPDEVFTACEKTDRIFDWALGRTLEQAAGRILLIGLAGCVLVVSVATAVI